MFCLDTNVIIDASHKKTSAQIRGHFESLKPKEICIPAIVVAELEFGAMHSDNYKKNMEVITEIIAPYKIIPFTEKEAVVYGQNREQLTRKGTAIGPNDLLIAATAIANGATLVTHNTNEFGRVHGLSFVDWRLEE